MDAGELEHLQGKRSVCLLHMQEFQDEIREYVAAADVLPLVSATSHWIEITSHVFLKAVQKK